jgi:hypothetical protein
MKNKNEIIENLMIKISKSTNNPSKIILTFSPKSYVLSSPLKTKRNQGN